MRIARTDAPAGRATANARGVDMAACDAPPGSWCNGTQYIVAAAARSLAHPQPPVFAHRVLKDAPSLPHEQRALAAPVHHGGCCCDICTSHCASSAGYNCDTCTGAATPQCAVCYYRALNHSHHHDTCYDPPHSPPMPETKICQTCGIRLMPPLSAPARIYNGRRAGMPRVSHAACR